MCVYIYVKEHPYLINLKVHLTDIVLTSVLAKHLSKHTSVENYLQVFLLAFSSVGLMIILIHNQ